MSTKAQVNTQAKTPAAPATVRIPQPPAAVPEHEAERPDVAAQLEGAARLGHSLGAVSVDSSAPPIIQRQEYPEEEEEELQLKREPAAVQRQVLPEEEEELMMKRDEGRVGPQGGPVPPEVEAAIRRARGGGQPLEGKVQAQMSEALGHDFSGVRVHTGPEADELNQQLQAKAFTTGPDIFFRRGEYNPGSSGSRELIAHELSHVVQQSSRVLSSDASGMSVRPAGDAFEQEAESVGHAVSEARSKTTHAMGGEGASNKGGRHPFVQRAPLPPRQVSPAVYRVGNDGTVHAMIDQANQILAQANIRIVAKSESEVDPGSLKDALKARMKYVAEATKGWDKEVYWKRVDGLSWGDDKGLRECWETFNDEVKLDLWHEAVVARLPELPDNSLAIVSSNIERGAFFGAPAEGVFGKTWRQDTQNKYIKHIFKIPEGKAVDTQKAICFVYPNNIRPGQAGETLAHELGHALLNSGEHVVLGRWLAKWWDRRRLMAEGGARTGTRLTPAEIASMRKSPYVTKPT